MNDPSDFSWFPARPSDAALVARQVHLIITEAISGAVARLDSCREGIRVCYRTGHEWIERATVPIHFRDGIFARIKLLAGIVSEEEGDQLGRIPWTANGRQFDIEVSLRIEDEGSMILLRIVPPVSEGFA